MPNLEQSHSFKCFMNSKYLSSKHESYFETYDKYFSQFVGKEITFVEIGIFGGGSLFMWREFFGEQARIIGIDLDENAKKWRDHGFEIFIGDQSCPSFWLDFFEEVGEVDIILDDGGHTYEQQIVTALSSMKNINDGGLFVVEDTHTSFMKEFGFPSKYTFVEWAKSKITDLNSRFPGTNLNQTFFGKNVDSIHFHESIVVFSMKKNISDNNIIDNNGLADDARDFRHEKSTIGFITRLTRSALLKYPILSKNKIIINLLRHVQMTLLQLSSKFSTLRLRKYFK